MRFVPFALVFLGCASSPKPSAPPVKTKPPVESFWTTKRSSEPVEAPLVALATRRTYFILATEWFGTACRAWTVEQSKDRDSDLAFLVGGDEAIGFASHGAQLELRSRAITTRRGIDSATCSGTFSVRELDDGDLDVGGARWFAHETDCVAALARKERVAMDWSSCTFRARATLQQQAASQRAFEAMLRFGGTAFTLVDNTCTPLHATPSRTNTRTAFEGELWTRIPNGRTGYGYQLAANAMDIVLLGPHSSTTDGGSFGMLCGDEHALVYGDDSVELGQTVYLSAASCRAARAKERARLSLLPASEGEVAMGAPPRQGLGGC